MNSISELLNTATKLNAAAAADAPLILAHVLGKDRSWLHAWPEYQPGPTQLKRYQELVVSCYVSTLHPYHEKDVLRHVSLLSYLILYHLYLLV